MANIKGGLSGGLSGAASGAAIGSVVPGIGTAIGAIGGGLLGGISGLFGGGDDTAPQMPPIVDPVTGQQLATADVNTQSGLAQQQAFVNALQAQNGIGNQSQVYNQLQGVANGTGPNPAQAALNQATGANVANQAALMAGQRGAGANAGLIARQAAQQGANIQQQAAGQGATMQAQQSLNAIGAAGNIANQQVGQQANAVGNYNQFAQNNQGQLLGARSNFNNAVTSGQGNVNNANQQIASRNADVTGGLLNGAGAAATALGGALGGSPTGNLAGSPNSVQLGGGPMDNTGMTKVNAMPTMVAAHGGEVPGPASFVGRHFAGKPQFAKGGEIQALVSPGERYLPPSEVKKVAEGKKSAIKAGEKIPGKAKVAGAKDSYANDTVHKKLQAGGVVLPRHVTQAKNPSAAAAKFVEAILSKNGSLKK